MRILMWLTLGFTAGTGIGIWLLDGLWLASIAVGLLVSGTVGFCLCGRIIKLRILSVLLAGCSLGMLWMHTYENHWLKTPRKHDGQVLPLSITVTDYGYLTAYGAAAQGQTTLEGQKITLLFYIEQDYILKPGDRVEGLFSLRYTGAGQTNSATYHQGKGIPLLAYSRGTSELWIADRVPDQYFAQELRHNILKLLDETFPSDTLGFARALLLGDSQKLSMEDDKAFQISGIRHIIAVSGLHVSVLFSLIQLLLRKKRVLSGLIALPVLLLFAAVAGFTPSIVRACVMHGIMIIASLFKKEYDSPSALSFAVLVILLSNPFALTAVSFQLSVGCIVGILFFSQRIAAWFRKHTFLGKAPLRSVRSKLCNWCVQSISVTLSTMITTLPLCAYYFGTVSLISVISNLLTLWLVTFCFYGIVLSCVFAAVLPAAGAGLAWLVSWPMRLVCLIARTLAQVPFASVSSDNVYVLAWLVFTYVLLAVFFAMGRKRPVIMVICLVCSLIASLGLSVLEGITDRFRVTVVDVGQGQCVIMESGSHCYVVDCGGSDSEAVGDQVAQSLHSRGIYSVDGLILTHFDKDHAGGAAAFMTQMQVDTVYVPDAEDHNGILAELTKNHENGVSEVWAARELPCGTGKITIYPAESATSGNESSLCILFQVENCDILITGDRNHKGEQELIDRYPIPDLEILVVGHHGAASSASLELLLRTKPNVAVISVGKDNSYGHPTAETLGRLELAGCVILRTDEAGTITFRG